MTAIKRIRREKGLTQVALASATNLSQPYIHDLEMGRRGAKLETLRKIAEVLGCTANDLIEDRSDVW